MKRVQRGTAASSSLGFDGDLGVRTEAVLERKQDAAA
jgi:hypothetical protein